MYRRGRPRAVYLYPLIAIILLVQAVLAVHDGVHATLVSDHCSIAQLSHGVSSPLPVDALSAPSRFIPPVVADQAPPLAVHSRAPSHTRIRAPPSQPSYS